MAVGLLAGLVNGLLVAKLRITPTCDAWHRPGLDGTGTAMTGGPAIVGFLLMAGTGSVTAKSSASRPVPAVRYAVHNRGYPADALDAWHQPDADRDQSAGSGVCRYPQRSHDAVFLHADRRSGVTSGGSFCPAEPTQRNPTTVRPIRCRWC